jgi:hypothetical protein
MLLENQAETNEADNDTGSERLDIFQHIAGSFLDVKRPAETSEFPENQTADLAHDESS